MSVEQRTNLETEINDEIKNQTEYSINEIKRLLKKKPSLYRAFKEQGAENLLQKLYEKYEGVEKGFLINWMYVTYLTHLLKEAFVERFPNFSVIESINLFIRFKLSSQYKLSQIFAFLKDNKVNLSIDEYNVKQMSLEQIFLAFAKQTLEKERKSNKNKNKKK